MTVDVHRFSSRAHCIGFPKNFLTPSEIIQFSWFYWLFTLDTLENGKSILLDGKLSFFIFARDWVMSIYILHRNDKFRKKHSLYSNATNDVDGYINNTNFVITSLTRQKWATGGTQIESKIIYSLTLWLCAFTINIHLCTSVFA